MHVGRTVIFSVCFQYRLIVLIFVSEKMDRQPLAPLAEFLNGVTKRNIQTLMLEVMPILAAPNLRKEQLIEQLIDHVRSSGSLAEVCKKAFVIKHHEMRNRGVAKLSLIRMCVSIQK